MYLYSHKEYVANYLRNYCFNYNDDFSEILYMLNMHKHTFASPKAYYNMIWLSTFSSALHDILAVLIRFNLKLKDLVMNSMPLLDQVIH